jgi:hypothetical protein
MDVDQIPSSQTSFYTAREPDLSPYWAGSSDWEGWSDGGGEILETPPIEDLHSSTPPHNGPLSFPPLYFPDGRRVSFDSRGTIGTRLGKNTGLGYQKSKWQTDGW